MRKRTISVAAGNTIVQPYARRGATELPPKQRVTYEVTFDLGVVDVLVHRAFSNKAKQAKDGGITVTITSHKEA